MEPTTPASSQGPVIGIIVVIVVLIVGGFYFFNQLQMNNAAPQDATTTDVGFAPTATSDDPVAIQHDLDAENFNSLDADLNNLDAQAQ